MATIGQALTLPEPTWKRIDEKDSNFIYDSNWTIANFAQNYYGSTKLLNLKTGKVDFYFYGSKIRIITRGNPADSDQVGITIDGVSQTFTCVSTSTTYQMLVYEKTGLTKTTHKVIIENLNASKSLYFDAIDIDEDGYMTNSFMNKSLIETTNGIISVKDGSYNSLTSKMTSQTLPSGRVFSSSVYSSNFDYLAFNQIDEAIGFRSNSQAGHLGYELPIPKKVYKYALRSGSIGNVDLMPNNWTFEGSNDGVNYVVLDTQTNQTWYMEYYDKEYIISNPQLFKYYRVNYTTNRANSSATGINEMKIYEASSFDRIVIGGSSENDFINIGMNQGTYVDFSKQLYGKSQTDKSPTTLGSGKVFKTTIDTSKISIKSVQMK